MYLVMGASGFLGSYTVKKLYESTDERIIAAGRHFHAPCIFPSSRVERVVCDIANQEDIKKLAESCRGQRMSIFYFAAEHNIDTVAKYPEEAYNINVTSYHRFLTEFAYAEKLFFSSTDCVYGDADDYYFRETDIPQPVNEYGRQKLAAEKLTADFGFTSCRLPLMYGSGELCGKKHLYDSIRASLSEGKKIELIDGFYRSAISYECAADSLYALSKINKDKLPEVINVCSGKKMSKYGIGVMLADEMKKPRDLIIKLPESEGGRFYRDTRAKCTLMDNSLLLSLTENESGGTK